MSASPGSFSLLPSAAGLQVEGRDMSPAAVFMLHEQLGQWIAGRVTRQDDGSIRELVPREGWAITVAQENIDAAEGE